MQPRAIKKPSGVRNIDATSSRKITETQKQHKRRVATENGTFSDNCIRKNEQEAWNSDNKANRSDVHQATEKTGALALLSSLEQNENVIMNDLSFEIDQKIEKVNQAPSDVNALIQEFIILNCDMNVLMEAQLAPRPQCSSGFDTEEIPSVQNAEDHAEISQSLWTEPVRQTRHAFGIIFIPITARKQLQQQR